MVTSWFLTFDCHAVCDGRLSLISGNTEHLAAKFICEDKNSAVGSLTKMLVQIKYLHVNNYCN